MSELNRRPFLPHREGVFGFMPRGGNFVSAMDSSHQVNQLQTNDAFSDKWKSYVQNTERQGLHDMQKSWKLQLNGLGNGEVIVAFLRQHKVIFDAGYGLMCEAAGWFAELAPQARVFSMKFSAATQKVAAHYVGITNLFFLRRDIAASSFFSGSSDYLGCDQVISKRVNWPSPMCWMWFLSTLRKLAIVVASADAAIDRSS